MNLKQYEGDSFLATLFKLLLCFIIRNRNSWYPESKSSWLEVKSKRRFLPLFLPFIFLIFCLDPAYSYRIKFMSN